jgi:hypothetical protein
MVPTKKIRILCDGWYDPDTNVAYARGSVIDGSVASPRLLMALSTRETYTDRTAGDLPICELVTPGANEVFPGPVKLPSVVRTPPGELPMPDIELSVREVPPIRIIESRMSVEGVKAVDLGDKHVK